MDAVKRQATIRKYLQIKASNHGEIHCDLLWVKEPENIVLEPQRKEQIKASLLNLGTNLMPLLVRQTEPDEDDREYQVIYGEDWWLVAQELEIETMWAWVFDVNDGDVPKMREEMATLVQGTIALDPNESDVTTNPGATVDTQSLEKLSSQLQQLSDRVEARFKVFLQAPTDPDPSVILERLDNLESKLSQLSDRLGPTSSPHGSSTEATNNFEPLMASLSQGLTGVLQQLATGQLEATLNLKVPQPNEGLEQVAHNLRSRYESFAAGDLKKIAQKAGISNVGNVPRSTKDKQAYCSRLIDQLIAQDLEI